MCYSWRISEPCEEKFNNVKSRLLSERQHESQFMFAKHAVQKAYVFTTNLIHVRTNWRPLGLPLCPRGLRQPPEW